MANTRVFVDRLNSQLESLGLPTEPVDRIAAFAKIFRISKRESTLILSGRLIPSGELLDRIAEELEVTPKWLTGEGANSL